MSDLKMSDLKPCPCCGSESVIFEQYKKDGYRIKCKNCALKREQRALCYSMEWLESKMKENWNNRPIDKEIAQLKDDKEKLVESFDDLLYWASVEIDKHGQVIKCEEGAGKFVSSGALNGIVSRLKRAMRSEDYMNYLLQKHKG